MRWTAIALLSLFLLTGCNGSEPESEPVVLDGTVSPSPTDAEALRLCLEGEKLALSDPAEAIAMLDRSLAKEESARAYLARALARLQSAESIMPGQIPAEIKPDLDKALTLAPEYTPALLFKAERVGLLTDAGSDILWKILDANIADDDGIGLYTRARARAALADSLSAKPMPGEDEKFGGRFQQEQAHADYGKAARLLPDHAELHFHWGYLLVRRMGRWKRGAEDLGVKFLNKCVSLDEGGPMGREAQRLLDEM